MPRSQNQPADNTKRVIDCGCVMTRPRTSRLYGARWRAYKAPYSIILRCLDCGKAIIYALYRDERQVSSYDGEVFIKNAEKEYEEKLKQNGGY